MQDTLKLQQKVVPEMIELLEKRYKILRTIYYNQPIGRRVLSNLLEMGERIIRTEISFLKSKNLIEINTPGMTITDEGEEIINKLKDSIHEIKGLSEIEKYIKEKLSLKQVIVVPGDMDEDKTIINELGKVAAHYINGIIKENYTIALTGGTTIKEVVDNLSKINNLKNILIIPARGGMGGNVETQANTLAASFANRVGGRYKLLHVPDNLSSSVLNSLLNEEDIKEIKNNIDNSNVLIFGIGRTDEMGKRRGLTQDQLDKLEKIGAVGEAFGYYFNCKGEIVYSTPTIGVNMDNIKKIGTAVAIAGGKSKAQAILAIEVNNTNKNNVLITDEGAAREMVNIISKG
jgi:central glycolytic genes regulator